MSQTKVQLIQPIGVVTASTLETTGVLTATTFVGDIAGTVTGITSTTDNLNLGIVTATSFAGDFTGIGSGLTGTPNVVAGIVTATKFVGNTPGTVSGIADGTNINAGIITATSFVGNLTGNAAGLSTTTGHANLGIVTATSFHGSGANLDGVSSGPVAQQAVTADGASTSIDLSSGNLIYMTQSANTTVSFANTEGNTDVVYLVRTKDDTDTARTITWPSGMVWNGGTEPTLLNINKPAAYESQVFKLTTRDNGATWYGVEVVNYNVDQPGELWGWGNNEQGQLGQNNETKRSSPVQVGSDATWSYLDMGGSVGDSKSAAINTDGELWMMGDNVAGGLGQNDVVYRSSPIQIPGTTWATYSLDVGMIATKTDNTLWTWGLNQQGQLGQNSQTYYSSPIQIPGTTWSTGRQKSWREKLGAGAIKTDGTLWIWGYNSKGQLGQNDTARYSSPVQIPGTTWSQACGARYSTKAIKTDGTLWAWGENSSGELGQNSNVKYSSPVQVGSDTTWSSITEGYWFAAAIKTDGTLWTWGTNGQGQLGQNSPDNSNTSSPVQVPGTTWSNVAAAYLHTTATKTDGTFWAWGYNDVGQLGQNDVASRSSPVQIPGTNYTQASCNGRHSFALRSV